MPPIHEPIQYTRADTRTHTHSRIFAICCWNVFHSILLYVLVFFVVAAAAFFKYSSCTWDTMCVRVFINVCVPLCVCELQKRAIDRRPLHHSAESLLSKKSRENASQISTWCALNYATKKQSYDTHTHSHTHTHIYLTCMCLHIKTCRFLFTCIENRQIPFSYPFWA